MGAILKKIREAVSMKNQGCGSGNKFIKPLIPSERSIQAELEHNTREIQVKIPGNSQYGESVAGEGHCSQAFHSFQGQRR